MDFRLTEEQKEIQQTVREFVTTELLPLEEQILDNESKGQIGLEREQILLLQSKAKDLGLWGIDTSKEYGGRNLGAVTAAVINMELGRTIVPFTLGGEAANILYACNEQQKQNYLYPVLNGEKWSCFALTEPESGSDAANMRTTAIRDGDKWIINGEKTFIAFGAMADFAIVFAVTDKEKGANGGITCFLVDRDLGWRSEQIPTMCVDTYPSVLRFENVCVSSKNILGEVGQGLLLAMKWIGKGRWLFPARGVGAAERLLQMAIDFSKQRIVYGEPLAEKQSIQWMIADSAVEIEAAKWMILHTAWMADQALDTRHQGSMVKLFAPSMANRIVDRVLQIHGSIGFSKKLPIERWYREMRVWRIFEGTDEIQRMIIARNLLKGHAKLGEWDE